MRFAHALCFAIAIIVLAAGANAAPRLEIAWPGQMAQGEVAELRVFGDAIMNVEGRLGKELVRFSPDRTGAFVALVGVDLEAKPGVAHIHLKATDRDGFARETKVPLKIMAREFRQESFKVAPGFDEMTPETLTEIRREQAEFARTFAAPAAERFWDLPFIRPVAQEASASSFGSRRIINGIPRSPHTGTDLSAPAGTEVAAVNHGRVALTGNFFLAGGTVVLDHGGGLFTMYFHLSGIKVEPGAMVRRGDVNALSGSTGRVTGPHLHWGVRLNNARVDPLDLLQKFSAAPAGVVQPDGGADATGK